MLAAFLLCLTALGACAEQANGRTTSYPVCTLPASYEATNPNISRNADFFEACVDIQAKPLAASEHIHAWDLDSLQLMVVDHCYNAVESVTFEGKQYSPIHTQYDEAKSIGVKISGEPVLASYKQLLKGPAKLCIRLKGPCLSHDSLYDTISYYAVPSFAAVHPDAAQPLCATAPLFPSHAVRDPSPTPAVSTQAHNTSLSGPLRQFHDPTRSVPRSLGNFFTCFRFPASCPHDTPPLFCGTDKGDCETKDFLAPGTVQIGSPDDGSQPVDGAFTVLDCCNACKTGDCNTFIIRAGVCFLKTYHLDEYPPGDASRCPNNVPVAMSTRIADIVPSDTIVGSDCTCA